MADEKLQEYRCYNCSLLLYESVPEVDVEIICRKCSRINYPARGNFEFMSLRGRDFQLMSIDIRCPNCHKLRMRCIGKGLLKGYCKDCDSLFNIDIGELDEYKLKKSLSKYL